MYQVFQYIITIAGAILSISFLIHETLKWRSSLKVQDSETCIIVRSHGKHLFSLIYAMFCFVSFIFFIIAIIVFRRNTLGGSLSLLNSLFIISIFYSREYRFKEEGIQAYPNSNIIAWEQIKSWKWLEYKEDVLWITYDKGYLKVKANEKKELITAFLQKYKNNIQ